MPDSPPPTGNPPPDIVTWPRRLFRTLISIPLAVWVFFEEWIWDHVLAAVTWLGRLPPIHWLEEQTRRLPPYAALIAFAVPGIILLPFKMAALWLIAKGHAVYGAGVFVIAKVIGTAFLARIFSLTKPALLTIGWFRRAYEAFSAWKEKLYAYVRSLPTYQWAKQRAAALRRWVRETWRKVRGAT